jgi:hypothetical protein
MWRRTILLHHARRLASDMREKATQNIQIFSAPGGCLFGGLTQLNFGSLKHWAAFLH